MNIDTLVQMANAIGQFFDSMPDRDEALDGVANHLRRYWEPRMRMQLLDHADGGTLHPLVADALRSRRAALLPAVRGA
jgi:formate dehydrogenase subunit delta